jgi:hypothetical protein
MDSITKHHNEYGAGLFVSAMRSYASGAGSVTKAILDACKGYAQMDAEIVADNGGVRPEGKAMKKARDAKLSVTLTADDPTAHSVCSWLDDRNQLAAMLWVHENPEPVDLLLKGEFQYTTPRSLRQAWDRHVKAEIKKAWEAKRKPSEVTSLTHLGVDLEVIERGMSKLDDAFDKKNPDLTPEPKPEPEPTPVPAPTMDIKAVIAGLDMATLAEALAQRPDAKLIADAMFQFAEMKARAAAKPKVVEVETPKPEPTAAVKYTYINSVGDLLSAIAPEVTTLALTKGNSSSKAATVRVSRRFSKVIVAVEGDHSTYDYSFKGKSLSVKMLKGFIMDAMMKHGTFPPEGGAEQIRPSAGPLKYDAAFQLQLQA